MGLRIGINLKEMNSYVPSTPKILHAIPICNPMYPKQKLATTIDVGTETENNEKSNKMIKA